MENQRIRLSKAMLKTALLKLLKDQNINRITISELCQEAEINRTTFYKYYGNQYDLLAEIEQDFFSDLEENIKSENKTEIEMLAHALSCLYEDRYKFNILTTALPNDTFIQHLSRQTFLTEVLIRKITYNYTQADSEYASLFYIHGIYALIRAWLGKENPEPAKEIAELLITLRKKFA